MFFLQVRKSIFRCMNDEKHTPFQRQFARQHWVELGEELTSDDRFKAKKQAPAEQGRAQSDPRSSAPLCQPALRRTGHDRPGPWQPDRLGPRKCGGQRLCRREHEQTQAVDASRK